MSDSEDEEFFSIYDTKTVCNAFNTKIQQMKTNLKKNVNGSKNILNNGPPVNKKCEKVSPQKKNLGQEKTRINKNDVGRAKDVNKTKSDQNSNSDSDTDVSHNDSSSLSIDDEDNSNLQTTSDNNESTRIHEPQKIYEGRFDLPPASSTRSNQKKLDSLGKTLLIKSPVRKKKRGTIDSYFKPSNSGVMLEEEKEIISIEDDRQEEVEEKDDDVNFEVSVKILWKSINVRRFTLRKFQKFSNIFDQLMKEENVTADKIILTLNSKRVKPTDTPESLDLKVYDIIDGGILSAFNNFNSDAEENEVEDSNTVLVKFQDNNKKMVKLKLRKTDKLKIIMLKYSEQMEIPMEKIKFEFDGDLLDPSETPITLGLESDEVIDVTFL